MPEVDLHSLDETPIPVATKPHHRKKNEDGGVSARQVRQIVQQALKDAQTIAVPSFTYSRPEEVPATEGGTSPAISEWYLCARCRGLGWVPSDKTPKLTFTGGGAGGVKILRHQVCPVCGGESMVKVELGSKVPLGAIPILQCKLCREWYAKGAGRPKEEPCYHNHARHSHCHWHDMSVGVPPNQRRVGIDAAQQPQWEGGDLAGIEAQKKTLEATMGVTV